MVSKKSKKINKMDLRKTKDNKTLIIYENSKHQEMCRDWDCNFIPQVGDIVDLSTFPLTNTMGTPALHTVKRRVIKHEVMRVLVEEYNKPQG